MSPAIPIPRLSDAVLALRVPVQSDVSAYAGAFVADPDLGRLAGLAEDPDEGAARAAVAAVPDDAAAGTRLALAVAGAQDDAFLGLVALNRFSWPDRRCDLGYWLIVPARGRGHATRAAGLLLDWAFPTLDVAKVVIATTTENVPSQALARRLGFTEETRRRRRDLARGRRVDVIQFGLLREEWPGTRD